jgi:protein-L-isoaspartate(D-aspartate) O-methyltransferase
VLAKLAGAVYTVEINPRLAQEARARLARLGYNNIEVIAGDGSEGLPSPAPFDVIIVSAGTPELSPVLLGQLAEGGRLVAPVGTLCYQQLLLIRKHQGETSTERLDTCQFVPLVGKAGWPASARDQSRDRS